MLAFFIRRVLQAVLVLLAVGLIAFSLFRFVGDPVTNMVGQERGESEISRLRQELGLDKSFIVQYGRFLHGMLQGNFGFSYRHARPVADVIGERFPATIELAIVASLLATGLGIVLGAYTALKKDSLLTQAISGFSLIAISLPIFLIAISLIYVFSVRLHWLPSHGRGDTVDLGWWTTGLITVSGIKSLVLPVLTLSLYQMTLVMRLVNRQMLEVLGKDFIRFARARGIDEHSIHFSHALKNSLVPVIGVTGQQFGAVIAFAVITETVFQWPGLGLMFIEAVQFVDIPVMASYLMLVSLIFVTLNFAGELAQMAVDPRLRLTNKATGNP